MDYFLSNLGDIFVVFFICPFLIVLMIVVVGYLIYRNVLNPGPVFFPSDKEKVKKMLRIAGVGKEDVVIDLGSGDGRILIAAAKMGARAVGYEIDPILVWQSRKRIKKLGLEKKAKVCLKSMWKADFSKATVITVYLFPKYMQRLRKMLEKLNHSVTVVSNDYQFPGKKHDKKEDGVYVYKF